MMAISPKILKKNYNYDIKLTVKTFGTVGFDYVMDKLKEIMDDNKFLHSNSKLEVIPKSDNSIE